MHPSDSLVRAAATALLAGDWTSAGMTARLMQVFGLTRLPRWIEPVVSRVLARFGPHPPTPRHLVLRRFLAADPRFCRAIRRLRSQAAKREAFDPTESHALTDVLALPHPKMAPAPAIAGTDKLPSLVTVRELADWLGVSLPELDWFADFRHRARKIAPGKLGHYHYHWIAKAGGRRRLVESPKPRLKQIQRRILSRILEPIPAHPAAHAFRSGHSTLSCASPHVGQRVVLRIDLRDFFPSLRRSKIHALFHALGFPEDVARFLTGLCTNTIPEEILPADDSNGRRFSLWQVFGQPHLPQGAPTSPALANLCAYRLDCRLAGLAHSVGANYTRYADDLIFSGDRDFERSLTRFRIFACAIVLAEGFAIRHRKTRVMRSGIRQSITGLIVNRRINVPRGEYDRLKAIVHNCRRFGPRSQNRAGHPAFRKHLQGKIAYMRMVHQERGEKLQREFDLIDWE
jgi:RNA-directed DNA polymerase